MPAHHEESGHCTVSGAVTLASSGVDGLVGFDEQDEWRRGDRGAGDPLRADESQGPGHDPSGHDKGKEGLPAAAAPFAVAQLLEQSVTGLQGGEWNPWCSRRPSAGYATCLSAPRIESGRFPGLTLRKRLQVRPHEGSDLR